MKENETEIFPIYFLNVGRGSTLHGTLQVWDVAKYQLHFMCCKTTSSVAAEISKHKL